MPLGECFGNSVLSDLRSPFARYSGRVTGSYLHSAFVEQPVDINQVGDVSKDDSEATSHMTRHAYLVYDTRRPTPNSSRTILRDGSIENVQSIGKTNLVFHSRIDFPVTLFNISFVPAPGCGLFCFHVVQERHEIILNTTGAHLLVVV